jgi:hypothetical protein
VVGDAGLFGANYQHARPLASVASDMTEDIFSASCRGCISADVNKTALRAPPVKSKTQRNQEGNRQQSADGEGRCLAATGE